MWSHARYDLHLTESEFWRLTLRELAALSDRHANRLHLEAIGIGALWALTANIHRGKGAPPSYPWDLFPFLAPARPRGATTLAEVRAQVNRLKTALGVKL